MSSIDVMGDITTLLERHERPLVFVTVGSDHHRFDRLIDWMDSWLARPGVNVDCVLQIGTATRPRRGLAVDYLDHTILEELLAKADLAVVQGGPMSIVESRRAGRRPIVVPRIARLAEVVDDHQVVFSSKLARQDLIDLAESEAGLHQALDRALEDPDRMVVVDDDTSAQQVARSVERFAQVADSVAGSKQPTRARVLMLGGSGRSGSTLLERMLDGVPAVSGLGEVLHLWERGLADDQLCGCSRPFSTCPFWSEVGKRAFGGWESLDAGELVALRHYVVRTRHSLGLVGVPSAPGWRLRRKRLERSLGALYRSAAEVSEASVLVDSSKHPAYAFLMRRVPADLRCVLVVRDPRAVAYSWLKAVRRPEVTDEKTLMPRYGLVYSSLTWTLFAVMFDILRVLGTPVMVVRYEDLVAHPRETLESVLKYAGLEVTEADLKHVSPRSVSLAGSHTVAGNPMRFRTGSISLVADEAWRTGLTRGQQWLV
ncbi:MAG: sulfotransferase, partial [Nocardioidaceae bacterium]